MKQFDSGAKSSEEAPRYDLLEGAFLHRVCRRMAQGAASHGERNYRQGASDPLFIRDRINHLMEHARKLLDGDRSEDHLGAIGANCNMLAFLIPEHETPPPTYDEKRDAAWRTPCQCGRLFTHPDRCSATNTCQAERHPHATQTAVMMTANDVIDDLP